MLPEIQWTKAKLAFSTALADLEVLNQMSE